MFCNVTNGFVICLNELIDTVVFAWPHCHICPDLIMLVANVLLFDNEVEHCQASRRNGWNVFPRFLCVLAMCVLLQHWMRGLPIHVCNYWYFVVFSHLVFRVLIFCLVSSFFHLITSQSRKWIVEVFSWFRQIFLFPSLAVHAICVKRIFDSYSHVPKNGDELSWKVIAFACHITYFCFPFLMWQFGPTKNVFFAVRNFFFPTETLHWWVMLLLRGMSANPDSIFMHA